MPSISAKGRERTSAHESEWLALDCTDEPSGHLDAVTCSGRDRVLPATVRPASRPTLAPMRSRSCGLLLLSLCLVPY